MKVFLLLGLVATIFTACPEVIVITDTATITGILFEDQNSNGIKDPSDAGLAGWTIYNDSNNDNILDAGELRVVTNASGSYSIQPGVGTLHIRHLMNLGFDSSLAVNATNWATDPRIVGGQNAALGAYPFMVALITASATDPYQWAVLWRFIDCTPLGFDCGTLHCEDF